MPLRDAIVIVIRRGNFIFLDFILFSRLALVTRSIACQTLKPMLNVVVVVDELMS
jgi:hypothetical protein